jgi:NACalpha-BTF3-like transcription factor
MKEVAKSKLRRQQKLYNQFAYQARQYRVPPSLVVRKYNFSDLDSPNERNINQFMRDNKVSRAEAVRALKAKGFYK